MTNGLKYLGQMADPAPTFQDNRQTGVLDMLSKKHWRIAGAAMAGTAAMLVTGAAGAIDLDDEMTAVNYAEETLISVMKIEADDDENYYRLGGTTAERQIVVEPGVALAQHTDRMLVTFTLGGLVFSGPLTSADLAVENTSSGGGFQAQLISKGGEGDSVALYSLTGQTFSSEDEVTLTTRGFAISGRTGSITMKATNINLAEIFGADNPVATHEMTLPGAIVLKKALDVTTMPEDPMAITSDRIATVGSEYKMFMVPPPATGLDRDYATLGTVMVDTVDDLRLANADSGGVTGLAQILDDPADAEKNSISFMGDFSFASKVHVDAALDCTGSAALNADLRQMDDDDIVMDTTSAVALNEFETMLYLCISVDQESEDFGTIPDTTHYLAITALEGISDAVHEPQGMMYPLRRVRRDGTVVHIPYLTTYEGYNQRIVLSNRGTRNATYRIMFRPEVHVTATPKMGDDPDVECRDDAIYHCGMLDAGTTRTLRAMDVVDLEGGKRTAATIMVEARGTNIDVSSIIVNKESQDTDTVVHHSMSM
jgi:hypothetical protein